ncbi:MAG TPA: SRPBCC family protein [Pilimelia sp.]|nr:SRPBCC family protein [Pilimelia sp.]
MDIAGEIKAMDRTVGARDTRVGEARTVQLRRTYDAPIDDVWEAISNPERIRRWFMPVSGELRLGGSYQLEGNAGGEILQCEPPRLLRVSWIYGEPAEDTFSEVEVRLSDAAGGGTVFELEHVATVEAERWTEFGPGAVGVGWDLALLGLGLHLDGREIKESEREAWAMSAEGRDFATQSSQAWASAHEAAGATSAEAAAARDNTTRFYAPEPDEAP